MSNMITRSKSFRLSLLALAGIAALGATAAPAAARDWDHGRRDEWRGHDQWRGHDGRWNNRPVFYGYAPRVYAPAPVYAPPAYGYGYGYGYAPPAASFNLVIPFR